MLIPTKKNTKLINRAEKVMTIGIFSPSLEMIRKHFEKVKGKPREMKHYSVASKCKFTYISTHAKNIRIFYRD
jgi:hypothetical protein